MIKISRSGISESIFFYSLIIVGIIGLLTPTWYNALPANFVFEGVLFLSAVIAFRLPKKSIFFFFVFSMLYVIGSFMLMAYFNPSNYLDFAQAFKAFIYVAPLCMFYRRDVFDRDRTTFLLKALIVLFLSKYLYSVILNVNPRMGSRPAIYVENNFELIFLMLFFFALRADLGRSVHKWFAAVVFIVLLSGSRSSMLALIVLFFGMYMTKLTVRTFFYLGGFVALSALAGIIFAARGKDGGIESIDRYKFMMVFLSEVSDWPIWKYFTGNFPISPLSSESCKSVVFYSRLFSFSEDGSCYSVVLHSYFLRVVLDHGLLGLAFLFGFIFYAMRGSGYSRMDTFTVLGIISASALSVSAMNSVFVSLALAIILGLSSARLGSQALPRGGPLARPL